jgi:hypothetical protein
VAKDPDKLQLSNFGEEQLPPMKRQFLLWALGAVDFERL